MWNTAPPASVVIIGIGGVAFIPGAILGAIMWFCFAISPIDLGFGWILPWAGGFLTLAFFAFFMWRDERKKHHPH